MRVLERGGNRLGEQLRVGQDDGEQVVEIVGNATRELADRLELLRLPQLLFQRPPLGHVLRDGLEAFNRAVGATNCPPGEPHQDGLAVAPFPRHLHPVECRLLLNILCWDAGCDQHYEGTIDPFGRDDTRF